MFAGWLAIVVRVDGGFVYGPRQIGCLLAFRRARDRQTDRVRNREATGITPPLGDGQPVGACVALLCFDGGGWPRAGMMHRARHRVYCCCLQSFG